MAIERKTLKSISEFSIFKYLLVFYLIFFILALIGMGLIFLFVWLGFGAMGTDLGDLFQIAGLNLNWLPGGNVVGIALFIVLGLIGSVFYAVIGTISIWIINIILKISGGIELRFVEARTKPKTTKAAEPDTNT